MLKPDQIQQIKDLADKGFSIVQIRNKTGFGRNTIVKFVPDIKRLKQGRPKQNLTKPQTEEDEILDSIDKLDYVDWMAKKNKTKKKKVNSKGWW